MVVVLVTDLVASTAQRWRLGEELADELSRSHQRLVVDPVRAWNGRLVKGTGDGVLAVFDAASKAIAAAVALREAFAAGDVTWYELAGHLDCSGLPVVEASRLQAEADPDEIICSELVRLPTCGRGAFVYELLPPLALAGFPEPVAVNRVVDIGSGSSARGGSAQGGVGPAHDDANVLVGVGGVVPADEGGHRDRR